MTSRPLPGYGGSLEGGYSVGPSFPVLFGGGGSGGIGSLLQPHVQQLKEQYNPRKVEKYMQRVERLTERMLPGATFGGGGLMPYPISPGGIIQEPDPSLLGIPGSGPFLGESEDLGSLDLIQGIGGLGPLIR
jgi:hypothetical protein